MSDCEMLALQNLCADKSHEERKAGLKPSENEKVMMKGEAKNDAGQSFFMLN